MTSIGDDVGYEIQQQNLWCFKYDYDIDDYYTCSGYIGLFSNFKICRESNECETRYI